MSGHMCKYCKRQLTGDEIALYRKLISRAAKEFCCLDCLAGHLGIDAGKLRDLIEYYRRTGICSLFARDDRELGKTE